MARTKNSSRKSAGKVPRSAIVSKGKKSGSKKAKKAAGSGSSGVKKPFKFRPGTVGRHAFPYCPHVLLLLDKCPALFQQLQGLLYRVAKQQPDQLVGHALVCQVLKEDLNRLGGRSERALVLALHMIKVPVVNESRLWHVKQQHVHAPPIMKPLAGDVWEARELVIEKLVPVPGMTGVKNKKKH